MQETFEIAGGSIPGRAHLGWGRLLVGRNNQDAYGWAYSSGSLVALVADGCSAGAHSELGAQLGVRLLLTRLCRHLDEYEPTVALSDVAAFDSQAMLTQVHSELVDSLAHLSRQLGHEPHQVINETLLFTILGVLITPVQTTIFALGDGCYWLNGQMTTLEPLPGNAPPYLAYALLDTPPTVAADAQQFRIVETLPTALLHTVLLGTDGVLDLAANAQHLLPGKRERLGEIDHYWQTDRYFRNPDAIRRRLALANSQAHRAERLEDGLLPDDTTLIVIRRRRQAGGNACNLST